MGIVIFFGLVWLIVGICLNSGYDAKYPPSGHVDAQITSALEAPADEWSGTMYLPTYSYVYNGKTYIYESHQYIETMEPIGSTVDLFLEKEYEQKLVGIVFVVVGIFFLVIAGTIIFNWYAKEHLRQETQGFVNAFIFGVIFTAMPIFMLTFAYNIPVLAKIILYGLIAVGAFLLLNNLLSIFKVKNINVSWGGNNLEGSALQQYIEEHKAEWRNAVYEAESRMGILWGVRKICGGIFAAVSGAEALAQLNNEKMDAFPPVIFAGFAMIAFVGAVVLIVKGIKDIKNAL